MGSFDYLKNLHQQRLQEEYDAYPDRSALGEVGVSLKSSVTNVLPKMASQAVEAFAPKDSPLEGWARDQAAKQQADMELPSNMLYPERHNVVVNSLAAGGQSLAPTLMVAGLTAINPWVGVPATAMLFGGDAYTDTYNNTLEKTGDEGLAKEAGLKVGAIHGTGDAILSFMGARFLKAANMGAGPRTVEQALSKLKNPQTALTFAKNSGIMMGSETTTEIIQDTSGAAVEAGYTGEKPDYLKIIAETGSATLGMTTLMLPFGLPGHVKRNGANSRLIKMVESPGASPDERISAAVSIYHQLAPINQKEADQWATVTIKAISDDAAIIESENSDGDALDRVIEETAAAVNQENLPAVQPYAEPVHAELVDETPGETINLQQGPSQRPIMGALPMPISRQLSQTPNIATESGILPAEELDRIRNTQPGMTAEELEQSQLIVNGHGEPFLTERSAKLALFGKGLKESHEVIDHNGGYALSPVNETVIPPQPEWNTRNKDSDPRLQSAGTREALVPFIGSQSFVEAEQGEVGKTTVDEQDRVTGRQASVNPQWVQDAAAIVGGVEKLRHAVSQAVAGKYLGPNQKDVVKIVLDQYEAALEQAEFDALAETAPNAAERMDYPEEWDADTRSLGELADEAELIVGADAVDDILSSGQDDAVVAQKLFQIIKDKDNGREGERSAALPERAGEDATEPGESATAGTPEGREGRDGTTQQDRGLPEEASQEVEDSTAAEKPEATEPLTEKTDAGDQTKLFATPSTFGTKKPKGEAVDTLDFTLEPKEAGLFDGPVDQPSADTVTATPPGEASKPEALTSKPDTTPFTVDQIPDGLTVMTEVVGEKSGTTGRGEVDAKRAFEYYTDMVEKLNKVLECVRS